MKEVRRRDDDQCLGASRAHTGERCDIVCRFIGIKYIGLESELSGHALSLLGALRMARRAACQDRDTARRRHKVVQQRHTLPIISAANIATPVTLPPGRAKLIATPFSIGSSPMKDITIGMVEDASLTARIATVETATTTSGLVVIEEVTRLYDHLPIRDRVAIS